MCHHLMLQQKRRRRPSNINSNQQAKRKGRWVSAKWKGCQSPTSGRRGRGNGEHLYKMSSPMLSFFSNKNGSRVRLPVFGPTGRANPGIYWVDSFPGQTPSGPISMPVAGFPGLTGRSGPGFKTLRNIATHKFMTNNSWIIFNKVFVHTTNLIPTAYKKDEQRGAPPSRVNILSM